jgi:hypothetical protein
LLPVLHWLTLSFSDSQGEVRPYPSIPEYIEPLLQPQHSPPTREPPSSINEQFPGHYEPNKRKRASPPEVIVISGSDDEDDCKLPRNGLPGITYAPKTVEEYDYEMPRKRSQNDRQYGIRAPQTTSGPTDSQPLLSSVSSSQASYVKIEARIPVFGPHSNQLSTPPPSSSLEGGTDKAPAAFAPDEVQLCPEQAYVVELAKSGRNVFYTGSAGCGKSTVLKQIVKELRAMHKNVWILAPTGRAALQVNGSTTWTYAGWTPDHHKRPLDDLRRAARGKFVFKRLNTNTDVVIIDEISMVENLHFERLNEVMKEARLDPKLEVQPAFGGAQMIVTGDFCQLPPVKPFQHCIDCGRELKEGSNLDGATYTCPRHGVYYDKDKWAFRSKAWNECNFEHVHLKNIHRQSDPTFIRMLQKCRVGTPFTAKDIDILINHDCMVHHATRLFATKDEVRRVNQAAFMKLNGTCYSYW